MRAFSTILLLALGGPAWAQNPDPLAADVAAFVRLLAPGGGTAEEIAAFQAAHPDFPRGEVLERRRQEALAASPQPADCAGATATALLVACAGLPDPGPVLERLYVSGAVTDQAFWKRWEAALPPGAMFARFSRIVTSDPAGAKALLGKLPAADRAVGEAWLALVRHDKVAAVWLALLPATDLTARARPGLFAARVDALRRAGDFAAATGLLRADPDAPWAPTESVIRALSPLSRPGGPGVAATVLPPLDSGMALARALAEAAHPRSAEETASRDFLAGWLALRDGAAEDAVAAFGRLAASRTALSQSRGLYWSGRAAAAAGRDATPFWDQAARKWPLTYHGQLAAVALGRDPAEAIRAARDSPHADLTVTLSAPLPRRALIAAGMGDAGLARAFLLRADEGAAPGARTVFAALALAMGLPDVAVAIARRMGRDGLVLPERGWPVADADEPLALAVIRQESSFDASARSPAGAIGLMQVMPGTASAVAGRTGLPDAPQEAAANVALGRAYLAELWGKYGNAALVAAAYNAGPARVDQWLAQTAPGADMIGWIEAIPFAETRNYVQRVMENAVVYAVRLGRDPADILRDFAH